MQSYEKLTQWISVGRICSVPAMDLERRRVAGRKDSPKELDSVFVIEDHMILIIVIFGETELILS